MKPSAFLLFSVMTVFTTLFLRAQNSEFTYFSKTYGGNDTINILAQAAKPYGNNYLLFGSYTSIVHRALYIAMYDKYGDIVWMKDFEKGPPGDPYTLGVIESGSQILVDNSSICSVYEKTYNVCFSKFNADGDTVLHKKYIQPDWQLGKHLIATPDGGYMIAGMEQNITADTVKAYALKIDSMGNYEWDKRYLMGNDARFFSVQHTPWDGGYIFGGMGYSTTTGYDMFVVKTTANGDTLWTKRYGNELNDCAAKINLLTTYEEWLNGMPPKYLMSGCYKEANNKKLYISVIDEFGNIEWEKKHDFINELSSFQVFPIIKPDKGIIGAGYYLPDGFTPQPYIASFHADGTVDWVTTPTINPGAQVYLKDLQPTPDGGYVLAGYQFTAPQTAWVLKIDAQGKTCSYVGCDSTVVVEVFPAVPPLFEGDQGGELQIYPVPATTHLYIRYQIPAGGAVWRLYNLTGTQVAQAPLWGGAGTATADVSHLPAGMYFYRVQLLSSGQTVAGGKIMVE